MLEQYSINNDNEIPQLIFNVYSDGIIQSKFVVDISQNYESIPIETLKEYSASLKQKFFDIFNSLINENNLERSYNSKSAVLSNISSLKSRVDEYIEYMEPIV